MSTSWRAGGSRYAAHYHLVVTAPPGCGKTKFMAEMLTRSGLVKLGEDIVNEAFETLRYRAQASVPTFCELVFAFWYRPNFSRNGSPTSRIGSTICGCRNSAGAVPSRCTSGTSCDSRGLSTG